VKPVNFRCGPAWGSRRLACRSIDAGLEEGHAGPAVFDARVFRSVAGEGLSGLVLADIGLEAAVQPREGVVECLRVARRDGRLGHEIGGRIFRDEAVAGGDGAAIVEAVGLPHELDREAFRVFLPPHERAFGAGDLDAEVVEVADADLRGADEARAPLSRWQ